MTLIFNHIYFYDCFQLFIFPLPWSLDRVELPQEITAKNTEF